MELTGRYWTLDISARYISNSNPHLSLSGRRCVPTSYSLSSYVLPIWMADRLTELQDAINLQAENLCNAIGVIQQVAQPSFFADFNWASRSAKPEYQAFLQAQPSDDIARSFAVAISATAKQLDALIGALPEEEASAEIQRATVHKLLEAYRTEGAKLARITTKLESRLVEVRRCLTAIAQTQLTSQSLESEVYREFYGN
ncbi:unnamed protein product [Heterobilharzia americana]|nr:unnamed protein product [Heterobilharzia americana]